MNVPMLNLKLQYAQIKDEMRRAVDEVFESQQFILGPIVESFEKDIAVYTDTACAVGVSSGTDALLLSLMALGVGKDDLVITTPFTFFSTASSISRAGAIPLFADIDPVTYTMDPTRVEETIAALPAEKRRRIKAVMPVHLYGQCADLESLADIAGRHGLRIIEDAAQALGAHYSKGGSAVKRHAGSRGDCGCFSFFPTKNLGACGEAGMVITGDESLALKLRSLRHHGCRSQHEQYHYDAIGINGRLDALQAAVLKVKLVHLDEWNTRRRSNADSYNSLFRERGLAAAQGEPVGVEKPLRLPVERKGNHHIYHQYVIRARNRDGLKTLLDKRGIGCGIYYPVPVHQQPCYAGLGLKAGSLPEAERASREVLALPIYPELTREQQEAVVAAVADFYNGKS
jgi:dTDP-4-amino-4,6-dideoxygalactose transaminase